MRKMYKTPTTENVLIEQQFAIMSASGERKQNVINPGELSSGQLG